MANDCKPRQFPTDCNDVLFSPPEDCCPNDGVERGWYNSKLLLECPPGEEGEPVSVPANLFRSTVSQEDADALAVSYAESQLQCGCEEEFFHLIDNPIATTTTPALPTGWETQTFPASGPVWTTVDTPVMGSLASFEAVPTLQVRRLQRLESPVLSIPDLPTENFYAALTFDHSFLTENEYDGGVLMVSIDSAAYVPVDQAGAIFTQGGYNSRVYLESSVIWPAWSGEGGAGYTTVVLFPHSFSGHSIRLAWDLYSDTSLSPVGAHWRIGFVSFTVVNQCPEDGLIR